MVLCHAVFHTFLCGEFHHDGRADNDNGIFLPKILKRDILNIIHRKAFLKAFAFSVIECQRCMEMLRLPPLAQVVFKQNVLCIPKACDDINISAVLRIVQIMMQGTAHRGHAGTSGDDSNVFSLEFLQRKAVAIGTADIDIIPCVKIKQDIGQCADSANRKFHGGVGKAGYGNRSFSDLRQRKLEKLSMPNLRIPEFDNKGGFQIGFLYDIQDAVLLRQLWVVHIISPPSCVLPRHEDAG